MAGQPGVEHAVLDVARHLLRADQHAFDLGIVDRGKIRAAAGRDVEAGAAEQVDGRVLQAAFGDAEFQFHLASVDLLRDRKCASSVTIHSPFSSVRKKQL